MLKIKAKMIVGLLFFSFSFTAAVLAQTSKPLAIPVVNEKIYLHFDKPYYIAGETIWFKAYFYSNGLPSLQSVDFFLQLEDDKGRVIDKKKYPISGATVNGSISLNDSMQEGYYRLKALTKTIALDAPAFMYVKNLFVFNGLQKQKDSSTKKNITLQFFPESGHLVDRIKTQVAFKATNADGNPLELSGVIKSDSGNVITSFKTFHDGIGKLSFTPRLTEIFIAEVELDGIKYKFPLPEVSPSGVYLKVSTTDSGKIFELTRSKADKDFFDTVMLVVRMNNDTVYENTITFGFEQSLSGLLKTKNIPSGILHFIVLNKNGVPMAERLSFVNNKEYISELQLAELKRDSSKRGENEFEVIFKDTVQRSFSVSVTDAGVQEFSDKENIYSRLLLTSDLRGYVYNPGFYFEKDDVATRLALDNLMLTHGWTRYNWKRKKTAATIINGRNHYLIFISGTVKDLKSKQPVSAGTLNLQIVAEDSSVQSFNLVVDNNGVFKLDSLLFFGDSKIYYAYASVAGKNIPVILQLDKNEEENIFSLLSDSETGTRRNERIDSGFYEHAMAMPQGLFETKYKLLGAVSVKTRTKRPSDKINEKYASPVFNSTGKLVLDNINYPYNNASSSVIDYILTNIRTIDIDRADNTLVNRKNFSLATAKNWKVELFVDESVSTVTNTRSVNMGQVAMIKFYEAGFVGVGTTAPGGAVAVYLKKGADAGLLTANDNEKFLSFNGYSVTQEFYQPDYSRPAPGHTTPDDRLTLYWNGFLQPANTSKNIKFKFFNNDISKKLSVIIEGFDAQGRLFHFEKSDNQAD